MVTVGIPRSLLFYEYFPWWETFLEALGQVAVVTSGDTTSAVLDRGVMSAVDEACLPVKIFYGHVAAIKDKVDLLFVPRVVSVARNEYTCPKLLGLPDMIRAGFDDAPPLIDAVLDFRKLSASWLSWAFAIGLKLRKKPSRIIRAYGAAGKRFFRFKKYLRRGDGFARALAMSKAPSGESAIPDAGPSAGSLTIGLAGHSYLLYDPVAGMGLLDKIRRAGARVVTSDMVGEREIEEGASVLPRSLFWTYEKKVFGAALSLVKNKLVDGLVQIVSFACGPDSMVGELVEAEARKSGIPLLSIVVDEHTGEAGVQTRLEAFLDMLQRGKAREAR